MIRVEQGVEPGVKEGTDDAVYCFGFGWFVWAPVCGVYDVGKLGGVWMLSRQERHLFDAGWVVFWYRWEDAAFCHKDSFEGDQFGELMEKVAGGSILGIIYVREGGGLVVVWVMCWCYWRYDDVVTEKVFLR